MESKMKTRAVQIVLALCLFLLGAFWAAELAPLQVGPVKVDKSRLVDYEWRGIGTGTNGSHFFRCSITPPGPEDFVMEFLPAQSLRTGKSAGVASRRCYQTYETHNIIMSHLRHAAVQCEEIEESVFREVYDEHCSPAAPSTAFEFEMPIPAPVGSLL